MAGVALEEVTAAVQIVFKRTHEMGRRELALVQSRAVLERPVVALRASVCPPPGHQAACRVTRHERHSRYLVAARPVRASERALCEGALVSVVPGGVPTADSRVRGQRGAHCRLPSAWAARARWSTSCST